LLTPTTIFWIYPETESDDYDETDHSSSDQRRLRLVRRQWLASTGQCANGHLVEHTQATFSYTGLKVKTNNVM